MKLYHGTNATIEQLELDARPSQNINGFGFYFTDNAESARKYGKHVICIDIELDIRFQPIDKRYVDNMELFSECLVGGVEWSTIHPIDLFIMCEDAYYVL
jgi:hypothetical protein